MNEKIAAAGNQVKQAFTNVGDAWKKQEPQRKKRILSIAIGLVVVAIGLIVITSLVGGRYVDLYPNMSLNETVKAQAALTEAQIPARLGKDNVLQVPARKMDAAMGVLAKEGIPSTGLNYAIFEKAGGMTTTDFEKRQYNVNQYQDRLQDIINTYTGVANSYVTIYPGSSSNRVWDDATTKSTASVKVDLKPGYSLTPDQVRGIRHLVSAAGVDPKEVSVLDTHGNLLAAGGEDYNPDSSSAFEKYLQQLGLEAQYEESLESKVAYILSLEYPDPEDFRVVSNVTLDYDVMTKEIMEYFPLEGTTHGVLDYLEEQGLLGVGQYTGGVVGEDPNTDIPTYADLDGDGELDAVDYSRVRDYLVSYVHELREKGGPAIADASISVSVRGSLEPTKRQALRELVAGAAGIPVENVTVHDVAGGGGTGTGGGGTGDKVLWFGIEPLFIILGGVVLLLLLVLMLVLMLKSRAKKKRLAAEEAALLAEQEEAERIQREIEERKQQLKNAAIGEPTEDAITDEVRDFARANPEITANLLRSWLKDGEG